MTAFHLGADAVTDDQTDLDAMKRALKEWPRSRLNATFLVGRLSLGTRHVNEQVLPLAILPHPGDDPHALAHHVTLTPHILRAGIDHQVRIEYVIEPAGAPRGGLRI